MDLVITNLTTFIATQGADQLINIIKFMLAILKNGNFHNVNLRDNISVAISITTYIVTCLKPLASENLVNSEDLIKLLGGLVQIISLLNYILVELDKVAVVLGNDGGVLGDMAVDQYKALHANGSYISEFCETTSHSIGWTSGPKIAIMPSSH